MSCAYGDVRSLINEKCRDSNDIRVCVRDLIKKYHPDKNPNEIDVNNFEI